MTCIYIEHSDYTKERLVYHDISIHTIPIKYRDAHQNLNVAPCGIEILSMESFMWYVNMSIYVLSWQLDVGRDAMLCVYIFFSNSAK